MYLGSREGKDVSYSLLDQYEAAGGSFIDTANIYAHWIPGGKGGESEILLGQWLKERGNRQQIFLASKVGFEYSEQERGLTARQIELEAEKSLRRLGVDTIDLYYAHCEDRNTPLEETMEAFNRLVQAGKVRFIGASNYLAWRLEKAYWVSQTNGWAKFCCIQQRHTYLRPGPGTTFEPQIAANEDLLDLCRSEGVTLLAYSALLSGAYTREDRPVPEQYRGPDTDARLAALQAVAKETGFSPNQVILAWMMQGNPAVLPLIAASTGAQLQENIDALNLRLTAEQLARLNTAGAQV
jgi:aryl-alcohol dehydrogenase-like predicted oxidoreductase